jgi:hypothetical protein
MTTLENMIGFYCKVVIVPLESSKGIVQSGFIQAIDNTDKIMFLENENGIMKLPIHQIRAVKKLDLSKTARP